MKLVFKPQTEWLPPESFPDLSKYDEIAIDLETKDPGLKSTGSGSVIGNGAVVGIAVAVEGCLDIILSHTKVVVTWIRTWS